MIRPSKRNFRPFNDSTINIGHMNVLMCLRHIRSSSLAQMYVHIVNILNVFGQ